MEPQQTPPPLPVIDYDVPPRADHVRRRTFIWVLAAGALMAGLLLAILAARVAPSQPTKVVAARPTPVRTPAVPTMPQLLAQIQTERDQQQLDTLMTLRSTPGLVVYEEDPAKITAMRSAGKKLTEASRGGFSQPLWGVFQPPAFRAMPSHDDSKTPATALLFAHERISPTGNARLVILMLEPRLKAINEKGDEADVELSRRLKYRIRPTTLGIPSILRDGPSLMIEQSGGAGYIPVRWIDGSLRANRPPQHNLRFFAGQVDDRDKSHFTVEYELGGEKGVIDGWLRDDDFLRIVPRKGKVERGTWQIDVPGDVFATPPAAR